jgi:NADH dehydrogenase FAD-containing subunit
MFTDARELPDGVTLQADVCIVGAGAAGVALAGERARVWCWRAGEWRTSPTRRASTA